MQNLMNTNGRQATLFTSHLKRLLSVSSTVGAVKKWESLELRMTGEFMLKLEIMGICK